MNLRKVFELVRLAIRNLIGYPLRTFLTALGVIIGVGAVIAMMGIGAGAEQAILDDFGRLGIDKIILKSVRPPEKQRGTEEQNWLFRYGLTVRDYRQIRETIPGIAEAHPVNKRTETAWWGSRKLEVDLMGVPPAYLRLLKYETARGRLITDMDSVRLRRVCIVRTGLLEKLGVYRDPIGMTLRIGEERYEVIGVLRDEDFRGYAREALQVGSKEHEVYVPYETLISRLGTRNIRRSQGQFEATEVELHQILVTAENLDNVLELDGMLKLLLEKNHEDRDYEVVVPLEALRQKQRTQRIFNALLLGAAAISLLVGGIGIANIMLASVTERTEEIGIRRALGAKRSHIVTQFMAEAFLISAGGGVLGVPAGFGLAKLLEAQNDEWQAQITLTITLIAFCIALLVGMISGIFPARRASYLDPIECLRHD